MDTDTHNYIGQLMRALPDGDFIPSDSDDSELRKLMLGIADQISAVHGRVDIRDGDDTIPWLASDFLVEWEAASGVYGHYETITNGRDLLTDLKNGELRDFHGNFTDDQRRAILYDHFANFGRITITTLTALAVTLGYSDMAIAQTHQPSYVSGYVSRRITYYIWIFAITFTATSIPLIDADFERLMGAKRSESEMFIFDLT